MRAVVQLRLETEKIAASWLFSQDADFVTLRTIHTAIKLNTFA